jgi:hypothetical protein
MAWATEYCLESEATRCGGEFSHCHEYVVHITRKLSVWTGSETSNFSKSDAALAAWIAPGNSRCCTAACSSCVGEPNLWAGSRLRIGFSRAFNSDDALRELMMVFMYCIAESFRLDLARCFVSCSKARAQNAGRSSTTARDHHQPENNIFHQAKL